jgi:hypothetical protein
MQETSKENLWYTLKGISGWSASKLQTINILSVMNMIKRKRNFMIFNKEYPYTLGITYDDQCPFLPIFPVGGKCTSFTNYYPLSQFISKRYKTEKDMDEDYHNILLRKQQFQTNYFK